MCHNCDDDDDAIASIAFYGVLQLECYYHDRYYDDIIVVGASTVLACYLILLATLTVALLVVACGRMLVLCDQQRF